MKFQISNFKFQMKNQELRPGQFFIFHSSFEI